MVYNFFSHKLEEIYLTAAVFFQFNQVACEDLVENSGAATNTKEMKDYRKYICWEKEDEEGKGSKEHSTKYVGGLYEKSNWLSLIGNPGRTEFLQISHTAMIHY